MPSAREGTSRRPYGGQTPEERAEQRRRRLLDAALELFGTRGYGPTTIDQICQAANVGLKGFYDEFATKEQLLVSLFDQQASLAWERVFTTFPTIEPGEASLGRYVDVFIRALADDGRVARVLFLESMGVSPEVERHRQHIHRDIGTFIADLYDQGSLGPPVVGRGLPPRVALALAGGILETLRDWLIDPGGDPLEVLIEDVRRTCHVFLAGVRSVDIGWL